MIKCCKGCMKRHSGCHAGCLEYKAEKAVADKENEAIRQRKLNNRAVRDVMWYGYATAERRKGKKVV